MNNSKEGLAEIKLSSLPRVHGGKVRDIFAVDDDRWLIVASDRLSAFDVVFPDPIPQKGEILTRLSRYWFTKTRHIVPNHVIDVPLEMVVPDARDLTVVQNRALVVKKLNPLPVEAVVRGYLAGSGWKDYQNKNSICGLELPPGMQLAERLPEPIFTPATKAKIGEHDENIAFKDLQEILGGNLADNVRQVSLSLYSYLAEFSAARGLILADTKFEFAVDDSEKLVLIDEIGTPDSSRFWPIDSYKVGISPPSFDKQYVRDWVEKTGWNKKAPAPRLPANVISQTTARYQEALTRITEKSTDQNKQD